MTAASGLSAGRYAVGVVALAIIVGSLGVTALRLRRRWLPAWEGAPARLAEAVIGLAALTAVMQVLGTLGLFRLAPLVLATAAVGLVAVRALPGDGGAHPRVTRGSAPGMWWRLAAIAVAAVVLAEWAGPTLISYRYGIRTFDSLWYHLPWAASFAQSGQITTLHFTDVEYLTAFYPATAELFHGLGIVLFGADILSPGLNLAWLGLVLLGAYCVGRPFGAEMGTLLGGALAMATPMVLLSQAGGAANDVVGIAFVVAAVALVALELGPWAPRGQPPDAAASPTALVLAAVSAGLAASVKLSMLAPVALLTAGVLWLRLRPQRPGRAHPQATVPPRGATAPPRADRAHTAALWLGPLVLAGGFWYLRNLIAVGNPLPWVDLPGLAVPAAPLQASTGFSVVHYLFSSQPWHGILIPGLSSGLGPWWPAVMAVAVIGPLLCLLPGAGPLVRMLGAVALLSLLAYLLTPESAAGPENHPLGFAFNLRYSAPALTLSLMVAPLAPVLRTARVRGGVLLGLALLLVVVLSAGRLWPHQFLAGQVVVGVVVALVSGLVLCRRRLTPRMRSAPVTGFAALVSVVVLGTLGFVGQRSYLRSRYVFQPHVSQLSRVWAYFRHVAHARVGIVGTYGGFFAYPLFGANSSNRVQYIAARGPHGSFTPLRTCASWRSTVDAARLRYLVSTPARDPWHPRILSSSPEQRWTRSASAAVPVLQNRAGNQLLTVFRLRGPLGRAGCPGG